MIFLTTTIIMLYVMMRFRQPQLEREAGGRWEGEAAMESN